jgi:hypothetical protein
MADRIRTRIDTPLNWQTVNPVLAAGELGVATSSPPTVKVGDGSTAWNGLPYTVSPFQQFRAPVLAWCPTANKIADSVTPTQTDQWIDYAAGASFTNSGGNTFSTSTNTFTLATNEQFLMPGNVPALGTTFTIALYFKIDTYFGFDYIINFGADQLRLYANSATQINLSDGTNFSSGGTIPAGTYIPLMIAYGWNLAGANAGVYTIYDGHTGAWVAIGTMTSSQTPSGLRGSLHGDLGGSEMGGTYEYGGLLFWNAALNPLEQTNALNILNNPFVPFPFRGASLGPVSGDQVLAAAIAAAPGLHGGMARAEQTGGVISSVTLDQSVALAAWLAGPGKTTEFDGEMTVLAAHIPLRWYQKIRANRTFIGPTSVYTVTHDDFIFRYAASDTDPYPNLQVYQSSELDGLVLSGQNLLGSPTPPIDSTTTGQYPPYQLAGIVTSVNGISSHAAHNFANCTAIFCTHGFHLDAEQYTSFTNLKAGANNIGILNTSTPQGTACVDYVINNPICFSNDLGIAYFNMDTFGGFGAFQHVKQKDGKSNSVNTAHLAIINGNWRRGEVLGGIEIDDFGTEYLGPNTWYATGKNFPIKIKDPLGPLTNLLADGTGSVTVQVGTGGLYYFGTTGFTLPFQTILNNGAISQTLVIDPFTASAETVTLAAVVDANHITITRGSPHFAHSAGALIIPSWMMNGVNADGQPWVINGSDGPYLNFYVPACEFYLEGASATWRQGEPADSNATPGMWRAGVSGTWLIHDCNGGGNFDDRITYDDDPSAEFQFYESMQCVSGWLSNVRKWWDYWTAYNNNNPYARLLAGGWGPEAEVGRNQTTSTAYHYALSSLSPYHQDTADEATATRGPWAPTILANNQTITNNTIVTETVGRFTGRKVRRITLPAAVNTNVGTLAAPITAATAYLISQPITTTGGNTVSANTWLMVDSEIMYVVSGSVGANSTATVQLARAQQGTLPATHANGATVYVGTAALGSTSVYDTGASNTVSFSTQLFYGYDRSGSHNGSVYGAGNALYAVSADLWLTWMGTSAIWLGWGVWLDYNQIWWPSFATTYYSPMRQWLRPKTPTRFRFLRPANYQMSDFAYGFYNAMNFAGGDIHVTGMQCLITDDTLTDAHNKIVREGLWVRNLQS